MAKSDKKWQTPGVVFQPKVYEGVRGGINTLVNAIRPTLGPLPRCVVNDRTYGSSRAELLDDGGIIARRIIQLSNREEDMGAMYLRQYPEAVLKGLETITETTRRFVDACMKVGMDGVFYAVQYAQAGLLTMDEYEKFGLPFDLHILEPARALWCNILHLHGDHIYFNLAAQYPCQIVNWHDRETGPSLAEGLKSYRGVVCGGINQNTIVFGDRSGVRKEAADAIAQTGGRRFILGTGCVIPVIAPHGNIMASRQIVETSG